MHLTRLGALALASAAGLRGGAALGGAPDMDTTNRTMHLAYASFCDEASLASWTCMWCSYPGADNLSIQLRHYVWNETSGVQGYVAFDAPGHRVIVAFRGTSDYKNDLEDAAIFVHVPKHIAGATRSWSPSSY